MAGERRSLQQHIRERQQSGFVGRGQLIQFQENFGLSVDDERRRFLFNIHGDAGVGKTFLTRQLQQIAASDGALTAYVDETADDIAAVMIATAPGFGRGSSRLTEFEKRAAEYRQRNHELESDPSTSGPHGGRVPSSRRRRRARPAAQVLSTATSASPSGSRPSLLWRSVPVSEHLAS